MQLQKFCVIKLILLSGNAFFEQLKAIDERERERERARERAFVGNLISVSIV